MNTKSDISVRKSQLKAVGNGGRKMEYRNKEKPTLITGGSMKENRDDGKGVIIISGAPNIWGS